jgi:hypothetical protein
MLESILSNEDLKPSSEIADGKIEYKFKCGISAYQEELTLGQDERLAEVLGSLRISDSEEIKLSDLLGVLVKDKLMNKFLNIILLKKDGTSEETDYSLLKNSELRAVVSDFFILNPAVKSLLQILDDALISKKTSLNTSGTEQS